MPVEPLDIFTYYDVQKYNQFNPMDCANWYISMDEKGKRAQALYPVLGRRHLENGGLNRLIFPEEPRGMFKSVKNGYIIVNSNIYLVNQDFSYTKISNNDFTTNGGIVNFAYLSTPATTYAAFVDGQGMFVYDETAQTFSKITDSNLPDNPTAIAAFGNRFVVCGRNTPQFNLAAINLGTYPLNPATCFTIAGNAVFAQESGIIRQFGVLHNTLYIFCDFVTGLWSNIPSTFETTTFPWKKNTSNEWDYGIADPLSLDIDFSMMVFLGQNRNGLIQVMISAGDTPQEISTKAIDLLFQFDSITGVPSPFLQGNADGFLYIYNDVVFYRLSAGLYDNNQILEYKHRANSIEFNFEAKRWQRCVERNGERCRVQKHVYVNNRHLVSVQSDNTVYELSGQFYTNDIRNALQPDPQAIDAYIREPFRYELVTGIISDMDYSESIYNYVEIDFVWGEGSNRSDSPFLNTVYIIDEEADDNGDPIYMITEDSDPADPTFLVTEDSNTPTIDDTTYSYLFKPHVELYWSDNGGQMYYPADVRQFSDIGYYRWRMRWYELGISRDRTFKLVCVSPEPIVILGAVMSRRRASGGAN